MKKKVILSVCFFAFFSTFIQAHEHKETPLQFKGKLSVLTLNTFLLPRPLSDDPDVRVLVMAEKICETGADIIFLQEVWTSNYKKRLIDDAALHGIKYYYFNEGGQNFGLGNGLLILSRYELAPKSENLPEPLVFSTHSRLDEKMTKKGAIKTEVFLDAYGWMDLYNAHLDAISPPTSERHEHDPKDFENNKKQGLELSEWISKTRTKNNDPVTSQGAPFLPVLAGLDLNYHYWIYKDGKFHPDQLAPVYDALRKNHSLVDANIEVNGFPSLDSKPLFSYDTKENIYAKKNTYKDLPAEMEDYIFVSKDSKIKVVSSELVFTKPFETPSGSPVKTIMVSDHYGVKTVLDFILDSRP